MRSPTPAALHHDDTSTRVAPRLGRAGLMAVEAFVALTAFAGGSFLVVGAVLPQTATVMSPPADYLVGTPFTGYLVPGLVLAVVVGGLHAVAFAFETTRSRLRSLVSATAALGLLIWIFVQMIFIPFSFLQAAYFAAGIAEIGFVMLVLGITDVDASDREGHGHDR